MNAIVHWVEFHREGCRSSPRAVIRHTACCVLSVVGIPFSGGA